MGQSFIRKWWFISRCLWLGLGITSAIIVVYVESLGIRMMVIASFVAVILTYSRLLMDVEQNWLSSLDVMLSEWEQKGKVPDSVLDSQASELLARWGFYRDCGLRRFEEWEARLTSIENLARDQLETNRLMNMSLEDLDQQLVELSVDVNASAPEVSASGIPQETINQLEETIQLIDQVLTTVEGMTRQTQLLSINAVIEAAKSGDEGRRFSEMAVEIRDLSTEAMATSERVTEIMSGLNDTLKALLEGAKKPSFVPSNSKNDEEIRQAALLTGERRTIEVKTKRVSAAQTLLAKQEHLALVLLKRVVAMKLEMNVEQGGPTGSEGAS